MQLQEIHLKNITCFEDLTISFMQEERDVPSPWIVLLGENGTGKSTLMQTNGKSTSTRR